MANLLLTGGRAPATLDLLRLLHAAGHRVFQADSLPFPLAAASRYGTGNYRLPKPAFDLSAFQAALQSIVAAEAIDLIIPTCEEVFYASACKSALSAEVFAPDIAILRRLHSKWDVNQLLLELKLPCPETLLLKFPVPDNPSLFFPAILKPEFSRFGSSVHLVRNENQWNAILNKLSPSQERWVWQRYLEGTHWGTYSVAREGRLLAHTSYRLQWRYGAQGAATFFESNYCAAIEEQVSVIVKALNYTGQIAFDFIQQAEDGVFYAIECNPRATSGVHLFRREDDLVRAFLGHNSDIIRPSGGPRKLAVPMLLAGSKHLFQKQFRRDFGRAKDVSWSWQDPLPAFQQIRLMAYWLYLARRKNITLTEATTWDIVWDGG